ncbi:SMI1/KNR4 family protein [Streptomyces uncialis]|uniref:SMI1/KNR4 family protein n=1 Tax=Streptomyces uncialis TaxID=1048205 RepID=UPI00225585F9|nr:SMI1/KNR4 family protein [Streptomyces uncialis]MCX4658050.1 SMI1/KNR4 family protein [Streptomyces uncialis]
MTSTNETTSETPFDWREFLTRWSGEWADAQDPHEQDEWDPELTAARWLGCPGASDADIAALEERIGHRLPPSLDTFLRISDGWRPEDHPVYRLAGTREIDPHENAHGLAEIFAEGLDEDASPQELLEAGMWHRAFRLDAETDATLVLIDPLDRDADGEWAVYEWAYWRAAPPDRFPSFRHYMLERYRSFHSSAAHKAAHGEGPAFANDTTRAQDAVVELARRAALGGEYEEALTLLREAGEYGRPRAGLLRGQLDCLLSAQASAYSVDVLAVDPVYAPDLLPVAAAGFATTDRHDSSTGQSWALLARCTTPEAVERAEEALRAAREGTYRFTAEGPLGEAADKARELARWGRWNEAWRLLWAALPHWRPLGPDHLAPLGLLADPVLGPVITPERRRLLLALPRGEFARPERELPGTVLGPVGEAPGDDPVGLSWLEDEVPDRFDGGYRAVFVADPDPAGLPARLKDPGGGGPGPGGRPQREVTPGPDGLYPPRSTWDADHRLGLALGSTSYDDRALAWVGQAAPGWSFAFDGRARGFGEERFVSPAAAASEGTRAVVVWHSVGTFDRTRTRFHLSVGVDGEEVCAFSVTAGDVDPHWTGEIPPWLSLDGFPGTTGEWRGDEDPWTDADDRNTPDRGLPGTRGALAALERALGLTLPRTALLEGPLHSFVTRSWTRPPGPGESYATLIITTSLPDPGENA